MIPAPVLLILGPLILAVAVYAVRRITLAASLVSAAGALALAWLTSAVPQTAGEAIVGGRVVGGEHEILGRTLALSPVDRSVLIALSLAAAALFLLAIRLRPDNLFFPGVLALLGITAAILIMETLVLSILLVELAAGVIAVLIQGASFGSTRGAWRFFLFTTLALPLLLIAGWQIDFQAANPGQVALLNPAVLLLTLGFAIYLTAVPFHLWMGPVARETQPLTQVLVFGFFHIAVLSIVAGASDQFPWFAASATPYQWFTFAGTLTVGLGSILALATTTFGHLSVSNLMVDIGALLMLLGLGNHSGLQAAWVLMLLRLVSLTVWATGLSVIRARIDSDRIDRAAGLGWQARLATVVLVLGGLSLAGLPLTPGFPGRWMATALIARENMAAAVLLLLGSAGGAVAVVRMTRTLFAPPAAHSGPPAERGDWLATGVLVIVLSAAVVLALYPQFVISAAVQIADHYTYLQ